MNTPKLLSPLALALALGGCGETDENAFTDLTVLVRAQVTALPADGGMSPAADGGAADGGSELPPPVPEVALTVTCPGSKPGEVVAIGPRNTVGGTAEFGRNANPPDPLPARDCRVCIDEPPAGWTPLGGVCQEVRVPDSKEHTHTMWLKPEAKEPTPPCDPLGDCNGNGTPDVREQGGALDSEEPFCELEVVAREGNADGNLLNGIKVTVGDSPAVTTGPSEANSDTANGTVVVPGLSCVRPHTVVVSDPTRRLGSQSATVEFVEGVTRELRVFVMELLEGLRWGNGVLRDIEVGERYEIPFSLLSEGTPVGHDQVTSCTVANPAVALADSAPGEGEGLCEWVEGVAPGTTTVTACVPNPAGEGGGEEAEPSCATNTVTVVAADVAEQ